MFYHFECRDEIEVAVAERKLVNARAKFSSADISQRSDASIDSDDALVASVPILQGVHEDAIPASNFQNRFNAVGNQFREKLYPREVCGAHRRVIPESVVLVVLTLDGQALAFVSRQETAR